MEKKIIEIHDQFITLGQLLKHESIISSGGMAKWYLSEHVVKLNGEFEQRRGKKLYNGDVIELVNEQLMITIVQAD
ncbi:S4 domain-containing protein YaaA [Tuanshanicoccus lijuaniae]|uniref:S4 domain-containing protein YaaA n=1 Tax=Aerococcaceae bacterium zg-1292 TaxID=2774330 RepID=UPI001BD8236F|nr:S4 domain-containing protein YaaA [Aerococcaceae bacterium zg-A91]MBS4458243.1 S4 domain-containing protein YaaA [Aerococcaceae bacterium zg-BR33]